MEFLLLFLSNSNTSKPLSTLRYIITTFFLWALSSCTIALPEFQTAASLAPGQHKIAAGGFSGRGLNASTGGLLVHNYGITDQLDLTSNTSLSRLNIEQNNIRYSLLTGPKLSNSNGSWALSATVGAIYTETYDDIDAGFTYLFTPTLYKSWKFANPDLTYTFFARSEFAYNYIRGRWFTVVGGYSHRYETERIIHYVSLSGSTNGPIYGVYFGYGLSLRKKYCYSPILYCVAALDQRTSSEWRNYYMGTGMVSKSLTILSHKGYGIPSTHIRLQTSSQPLIR